MRNPSPRLHESLLGSHAVTAETLVYCFSRDQDTESEPEPQTA